MVRGQRQAGGCRFGRRVFFVSSRWPAVPPIGRVGARQVKPEALLYSTPFSIHSPWRCAFRNSSSSKGAITTPQSRDVTEIVSFLDLAAFKNGRVQDDAAAKQKEVGLMSSILSREVAGWLSISNAYLGSQPVGRTKVVHHRYENNVPEIQYLATSSFGHTDGLDLLADSSSSWVFVPPMAT